jgi:hypothetical protein
VTVHWIGMAQDLVRVLIVAGVLIGTLLKTFGVIP